MEKSTYLTFVLAHEFFAVNVANVLEVLEQQQITRVPKAPEHIMGIINFRGDILPVVNTRLKFSLGDDENIKNYIIVFDLTRNHNRYPVSAVVDGVKDVIEINSEEVMAVPEMGLSFDTRFITGVIRRNNDFIMLINPEKVFSGIDTEAVLIEDTTNQYNLKKNSYEIQ